MIGGGPFNLNPGEWTDDTSMALCLAESILETRDFDPADQMSRMSSDSSRSRSTSRISRDSTKWIR
ncbi:ADP-ribosylglycohydrolase family protein [Marinobacter hydrocarbonoclasticus]|nr:ADP-ribosylglycohydrolase family protein [Marinobacter nauticus]